MDLQDAGGAVRAAVDVPPAAVVESNNSASIGKAKKAAAASAASAAARSGAGGDVSGAVQPTHTLSSWLKEGPFALSMSPGFFGFYAHIGALVALEEEGLLREVSFATGASAGGLIAGLFAAGLSPADMGKTVVNFRRSDFWDPVGFGGILRGKKFEEIVRATLPEGVRSFHQCRVPLAVSAFDVSRFATRTLEEGCIAEALRATCTFPGLFAPVWHERGVLVDGGLQDTTGMWCVPEGRNDCRRVLNVTFGARDGRGVCVPPSRFPTASNPRPTANDMEIVSLPLAGLPRPHPFAMERGADAMEAARSQVAAVLQAPLLKGHEGGHWIAPTVAQPPGSGAACTTAAKVGRIGLAETMAVETKEWGTSSGGIGGNKSNGGLSTAAAASRTHTTRAAGGGTASAAAAGDFAHSTFREQSSPPASARCPSDQRTDRGTPRGGGSAAPITTSPAAEAGSTGVNETAAAAGPAGAAITAAAAAEPHLPTSGKQGGGTSKKGGQKKRRRSGVACLRDYNVKGLAEDCRKGRRGRGEGPIPPARRSKRSRKQGVSSAD